MQAMPIALWVVVVLVAVALLFDLMNGFHDAANSIATVVSTGVLKPQRAVAFAAFRNVDLRLPAQGRGDGGQGHRLRASCSGR